MRDGSAGTRRRTAVTIGVSILLGAVLAPVPGFTHVGGSVKHLWSKHIRPQADARYLTRTIELPANCESLANFGSTFAKIADIGTFKKSTKASKISATFEGRIQAGSLTDATGARFELRIDDVASSGRGRAVLKAAETGSAGVPVSFSALFKGLAAGDHTVSMWVAATQSGSGTDAMFDWGCWSTDKVIVREFR